MWYRFIDKITAEELFSRIESDRSSGQSLRVRKRRVMMAVRLGSFSQ